ncbi:MAG: hypothetical protein JJE04_20150 [Acidobacteriia bacterium]|nr:hypothetical protein [Terriglobia bacterium]
MKRSLWLSLAACLLTGSAQARLIHESPSEFRLEGHINAGQAIEVRGVVGNVIAAVSATDSVQVFATGDLRDVTIQVKDHDGGTTVSVAPHGGGEVPVNFKVLVPAGVKFVGRTNQGRIQARLPRSSVEAHTVDGDIEIHATGSTRASTVNGSITAIITGASYTDLHTINGSVTVTVPRTAFLQLDAHAVHGTVTLPAKLARNGPRLKLGTTHGDIRVFAR